MDNYIGKRIDFVLQGTTLDPPITQTAWKLRQSLAWDRRWPVVDQHHTFYSDIKPHSKQHFTE